MASEIPLKSIPNQELEVVLDNQNCTLHLYQRGCKMYLDLAIDNSFIYYGLICQDRNSVIKYNSSDFQGNLIFIDKLANKDPEYSQFGSRYILIYLTACEVNQYV